MLPPVCHLCLSPDRFKPLVKQAWHAASRLSSGRGPMPGGGEMILWYRTCLGLEMGDLSVKYHQLAIFLAWNVFFFSNFEPLSFGISLLHVSTFIGKHAIRWGKFLMDPESQQVMDRRSVGIPKFCWSKTQRSSSYRLVPTGWWASNLSRRVPKQATILPMKL